MIQNVIKSLFSVQGGKSKKTYRIFGIKFKRRSYTYMIRAIYKWQQYQWLCESLKSRNIALPPLETISVFDDYEITNVALKDIRRKWQGKTYMLSEASLYKYLQTRDKQIYADYVQKHIDLKIVPPDADKSPVSFESLEEAINKDGYNPAKCVIVLDKNNNIVDGLHRSCILYYKYGGDFTVKVVREK